jgi:hypothetical protein
MAILKQLGLAADGVEPCALPPACGDTAPQACLDLFLGRGSAGRGFGGLSQSRQQGLRGHARGMWVLSRGQ